MNKYFGKLVLTQLVNLVFPFIFMKLIIQNSGLNSLSEIEALVSIGTFGYLSIEFSFVVVSTLLTSQFKPFAKRKNFVFTNIVCLRFALFLIVSIVTTLLILLLNINEVTNWQFIYFYLFAAVIDIGWLYLLNNKYYNYIFFAVFIRNILFIAFLFLSIENISVYYLAGYSASFLIINFLLIVLNSLRFKTNYISYKYIKKITSVGYKIALSDLIIASYTYLDVYLVVFLLGAQNSAYYIIVRKLVRGATSLVGQMPRVILRKFRNGPDVDKNTILVYFGIAISIFIAYNLSASLVYGMFLGQYNDEIKTLSLIQSLIIIVGPIQNLYLQTYILKNGSKNIYISSYLFGFIFYISGILLSNYFSWLDVYLFSALRVISDIMILLFSFTAQKVSQHEK